MPTRIILLTILLALWAGTGHALHLPAVDVSAAINKAAIYKTAKAASIPVQLDVLATEPDLEGPITIWLQKITVETHQRVSLHASRISLPAGSTITVYGGDEHHRFEVVGPMKSYVSKPIRGPTLHVEVAVPRTGQSMEFVIAAVDIEIQTRTQSHHPKASSFAFQPVVEANGNVNYSCVQTPATTPLSRATVDINLRKPDAVLLCSATLVNNTLMDGKPYLLSATHCEANAPELTSERRIIWAARAPCGKSIDFAAAAFSSIQSQGASIRAAHLDVTLYELDEPPPVAANPYWAGWDRVVPNLTIRTDSSGFAITGRMAEAYGVHHAGNRPQQWIRDSDQIICLAGNLVEGDSECGLIGTAERCPAWFVAATRPIDGQVSPGSSGSGLAIEGNRLIGVASTGFADAGGGSDLCTGQTFEDLSIAGYSALYRAWDGGGTPATSLKSWLDPTNSGVMVLDGAEIIPPEPITMDLSVLEASVLPGARITLTWSTTNATSCEASGGWSGGKLPNDPFGPEDLQAADTVGSTTYTLTCSNSGFSQDDSVTVTTALIPPTVTLVSSSASVEPGQAATLSWSSTNATSCSASGDWNGAKSNTGSESVSTPTTESTSVYLLTCTGPGGTQSSQVSVDRSIPRSGGGGGGGSLGGWSALIFGIASLRRWRFLAY